eukprot:CAMPEP_0197038330 /NCGR_PEP_ID=MMETSP1384-20130603/15286_1 /TAXON_ID=29189 /ORGANISM="Ammonia sp." /LENGTH=552 /DNA_ID=CAMNT_0042468745 /DNA_START=29 /DNA_END=1687 /DNA_ORIENTATION=-
MYQRSSNRNRNQLRGNRGSQRQSNTVSFQDPLPSANVTFAVTDFNNQHARLQQFVRQQSPSSTISSSMSTSPPALSQYLSPSLSNYVYLNPPFNPRDVQNMMNHQLLQQQLVAHAMAQQQFQQRLQQYHPSSHHRAHQSSSSSRRHHHHLPPQAQPHHAQHHQLPSSSRQHRLQHLQQQQQQQQHRLHHFQHATHPDEDDEDEVDEVSGNNNKRLFTSLKDFEQIRVANKATYSIDWNEWQQRVESVRLDEQDSNQLILDYLLCEGDYDIAHEFSQESGTHIQQAQMQNMQQCQTRADIKYCINNGDILRAMELLDNYDAAFLQKYEQILLELQKQHLIELIHAGKIGEAYEYNFRNLLPKTKLNGSKKQKVSAAQKEKKKKLLVDLGDIMSLIACRNVKNMPMKQRNLLSLDRRVKLANKINQILLRNENKQRNNGESLLYENMMKLNYYQDFLMNLGIKDHKISSTAKIMSYNEENINKVKAVHPEFGKNTKQSMENEQTHGIQNWVKLDDSKCRLKVKNYLPFSFDTSKCQRFRLNKMKKYNVIHVADK